MGDDMGATRKRQHLLLKGFEYIHTQDGAIHNVVFKREVNGSIMEFKGIGPDESKATECAALKANQFIFKNQRLFPEVYANP